MSWLLISNIIASICGFIWTLLMARYLGVEEYGIMGFAISLTGILAVTTDFGISAHIIRYIATDYNSAPKYLGNAIPLKSIFSLGTIILTLIILIIMNANKLTITITLLFAIEMIIKSFINLLNGLFQAFEEGKYQGIGNTILNVLLLIFILLSIYTDTGLYGITISYIIANIIALTYEYLIINNKIVKPKFEIDKEFDRNLTISAIPFAIGGLLFTVYYSIDTVMLTNLIGDYATGIYSASYKLISILTLFYSIYNAVIYPVMSKFYVNDKKLLVISFEKSIKYLMLVTIPFSLAIMYYSSDIIYLIFGQNYGASATVLSILIWTVCLLFANNACGSLLNASHEEVSVTKIYAIAAFFNIVLNMIFIPFLSYNGAAITTVLSDLLILILMLYLMYKLGIKINKKLYYDLIKIIISSIILGISLYLLNLNMWVALPVGIIIYFAVVYLLRLFDDDDKYIIKEILNKN